MSESRNSRITQMPTEADLNYQVSNTVSFRSFRALRDSDNINNAKGTPVLIVDEQNNAISKINLGEWGNVGDKTTGPRQEINYTGKKLDIPTRLYYFNQRYYDPEIGRFVNEDPAGQGINPYVYCSNNPLIYTDPDGQFFTELFTAFCPGLGSILGAALDGGLISAGINATAQLAITGRIDGQGVLNAFGSGALSGGLANMIGGVGGAFKEFGGESLLTKTLAHGVSGGLQSMAGGGSFGSGFAGGAIGNLAGGLGGTDIASRTLFAGLGAGAAAWATGGDFWQGAQSGAYAQIYNFSMHEGLELLGDISNALEASGVLPAMEAGIVGNSIGKFGLQLEKMYAEYGAKSVLKSLGSLEKQLSIHEIKLPNLQYKSSVEREIRTFKNQINAIKQFLNKKGI